MSSTTKGKIFITGATGHIGSVVADLAIKEGYQVRGLSRGEAGDKKLRKIGAVPVRGDLDTLDVLRQEATQADIILHLANSLLDRLGPKSVSDSIDMDCAALDALAEPNVGTNKPLVMTSGCLVIAPNDGKVTDEDSPCESGPFAERVRAEQHAMTWVEKGVKVSCIRPAPYVYGNGGSGVGLFIRAAVEYQKAMYVDDGHWPITVVHVDDVARLYLLTAQKAKAGDLFIASSQIDLTVKDFINAVAATCNVPAISITKEQAKATLPWFLAMFLTAECRASSAKAQSELGWSPVGPGLLDELSHGSYKQLVKDLGKGSS